MILNINEQIILSILLNSSGKLSAKDIHIEMIKEFNSNTGAGGVYITLNRLVKEGLIKKEFSTKRKPIKFSKVTKIGKSKFEQSRQLAIKIFNSLD